MLKNMLIPLNSVVTNYMSTNLLLIVLANLFGFVDVTILIHLLLIICHEK